MAVVGSSGAGKSTLVNLLLRFWDDYAGAITIVDRGRRVDHRALPADDARALFSVVSQRTYLFNGTIRENLRLIAAYGVKLIVIISGHAATNQIETLNRIAGWCEAEPDLDLEADGRRAVEEVREGVPAGGPLRTGPSRCRPRVVRVLHGRAQGVRGEQGAVPALLGKTPERLEDVLRGEGAGRGRVAYRGSKSGSPRRLAHHCRSPSSPANRAPFRPAAAAQWSPPASRPAAGPGVSEPRPTDQAAAVSRHAWGARHWAAPARP